jgi:PAS domain S-box-containing protein
MKKVAMQDLTTAPILRGLVTTEEQATMANMTGLQEKRGRSIRSRLILLLILILIPVLAIQAYMYYGAFQERKAAELRSNLEIARAVAKSFDTFVRDVLRLELAVGFALTSSPGSNRKDQNRILLKTREDNPELWEIFWVSPKGVVLSATGTQFLGINFADREYFKKIVAGREYVISDLLLSRTTRKPSFTISRAIRDKKGLLIGVVTIGILPERLDKALGVERFKGGGLAIVDSKGMLTFRYPVIETTWEERNWLKQYPQFGDALKGKEVSATVYAPFEGKNRMVGFTPIPSIGWAASAGQREEEVIGPILAAIGRNAVIAGLILAMAFFIALSVARRIANPIMMLRQYARALGRGQGGQPLPAQSVSELNDLADAFNAMAEDLSARKTALQESERRWATTLSSIGDAVIATDVAGRITFMNAVAEQLTGWRLVDAATKPVPDVFNIINEQTRREVENPVTKVLKEGMIIGLANHTILIRKDGTEIPIDDSGAPIRGADGETLGVVLVFRDISERKQTEEALRTAHDELEVRVQDRTQALLVANAAAKSEHQRLYDVLETLPVYVILLTPDYHVPFANRFFRERFGDSCGMRCYEYLFNRTEPCEICETYSVIKTNAPHHWEWTGPDRRNYDIYDFPFVDSDGSSLILEMGIDITRQKEAQEALGETNQALEQRTEELQQAYQKIVDEMDKKQRLEDQLRQSQKMEAIGTLAGGIAHDFNNILGAIVGFTEMAIDDVEGQPLVERNLHAVLKSAMRARDLVKQILAFSRKTNYERTPLSLTPLMKETVQLLRASIPATVEIRFTNTASSDMVLASPVEVQQVLMNLATNASLAIRDKGTLEVSLSDVDFEPDSPVFGTDVAPGEYLQLAVKDTGTGMSPDVMKRVFEPFFTTRELGKGTGMGLAVVYGIVKDLQGTITVESTPEIGSTFRVLLPKIRTELKEEELPTAQTPGGKERILFVDDEGMLVEWGKAILERIGYMVTAMTDSTEALKTFSSNPDEFDLVITDQTMTNLTGVELAKELLKIRPHIPVIICTGHSEAVSPEKAKEIGIREYLMKPLVRQELAAAVRRALLLPQRN